MARLLAPSTLRRRLAKAADVSRPRRGHLGSPSRPGDRHEPMRRFVRLRPLDDLTIQIRNLLVQPMKRVDQDLEDWSGDLR